MCKFQLPNQFRYRKQLHCLLHLISTSEERGGLNFFWKEESITVYSVSSLISSFG